MTDEDDGHELHHEVQHIHARNRRPQNELALRLCHGHTWHWRTDQVEIRAPTPSNQGLQQGGLLGGIFESVSKMSWLYIVP